MFKTVCSLFFSTKIFLACLISFLFIVFEDKRYNFPVLVTDASEERNWRRSVLKGGLGITKRVAKV